MTSSIIFTLLLSLLSLLSPNYSLGSILPDETFKKDEHCVAYQTKKRVFLVSLVKVIGKNCDISSEIIPEPGNQFHVEVAIPILSFESGEVERDRDVAKLLKVEDQKNLEFKSETLTNKKWQENIKNKDFDLKGELIIAGKHYPVVAKIHLEEDEKKQVIIEGVISSKFKNFGLKPPLLWGGIGAKVSKDLNLFFHLQPTKTLGASFLLK